MSDSCENAADIFSCTQDDLSACTVNAASVTEKLLNGGQSSYISDCPRDLKGTSLKSIYFVLNNGLVFCDKLLPDPTFSLSPKTINFSPQYYADLHFQVRYFILMITIILVLL